MTGTSHDPQHGAHRAGPGADPQSDRLSSILALTQFLFTGIVIGVVAGFMYMAGLRSGQGHGGEGGGAPPGSQVAAVDVHALMASSPEMVSSGKIVFEINCASCHGTGGKGDGPAASALNPKPRDFTAGYWRYGGGVARIVQTITAGSPGTAMAPFPGIPLQDRFALAHYIRSFDTAKQEADKPEDLAWLDQFGGAKAPSAGGGDTTAVGGGGAPGDTIPIERAMALLAELVPAVAASAVGAAAPDSSEGGILYARRCASCHGMAGEGGVRTGMLGSAPYAYVTTRPLGSGTSAAGGFDHLVIHGIPGMMPGNGDLTSEQIRALYAYTQSLRARQESAARDRS